MFRLQLYKNATGNSDAVGYVVDFVRLSGCQLRFADVAERMHRALVGMGVGVGGGGAGP